MPRDTARRALVILVPAIAVMAGCPPKDGAARTEPATSDPATAEARPTSSGAGAPVGLDPTPVLTRSEMGTGLVIEDLKLGEGDPCWPGGVVKVHLRGWAVANGKLFDDTYAKGAPVDIALRRSIKGIAEGVPGMRAGGKRRLHIPPDMAYRFTNIRGENDEILVPSASPIIIEVEVVEVRPARFVVSEESSVTDQPAPTEQPAPR